MTRYRINFTIVESGHVTFTTAAQAEAAYAKLTKDYALVDDVGGEVVYIDTDFNYNKPIIIND